MTIAAMICFYVVILAEVGLVSSWMSPTTNNRISARDSRTKREIVKLTSLFVSSKSTSNNPKAAKPKKKKQPIKKKQEQHVEPSVLFQQLDQEFAYQGRIPSRAGQQDENEKFRCGYVSILGAPNMGKSTLLNALLKEDLCIATRRPQTTRHAILGVLTTKSSQLCLIDTPGIIGEPAYKLQEGMMEAVHGAFTDSDALLVVTDLFSSPIPDDDIFQKLQNTKKPIIVAINKIDLEGRAQRNTAEDDEEVAFDKTFSVPEAVAKWRSLLPNAMAIVPLSATDGPEHSGVNLLRQLLVGGDDIPAAVRNLGRPVPGMFQQGVQFLTAEDAKQFLPIGPPLYDEEALTDRSERFFCSELIREAIFECLNKEVPYCCEVQVHYFKEPRPGTRHRKIGMKARIIVERESQKGIVVGKNGQQIKEIGVMAREKIENFLQASTVLELQVVVNKDWRKKEDVLKAFGYLKQK
jgi:GTP-binding protein Era